MIFSLIVYGRESLLLLVLLLLVIPGYGEGRRSRSYSLLLHGRDYLLLHPSLFTEYELLPLDGREDELLPLDGRE